jgi:hypothetical protein
MALAARGYTMESDYRIAVEDGIIRVEPKGRAHYEFTRDMLVKVGELAASTRNGKLLFDLRNTDYRDSYVSTIRHAEEAEGMGLGPSLRVALVGVADDPMLQYVEDVSVNRGYQVRAFSDEDEAVKWLHGSA